MASRLFLAVDGGQSSTAAAVGDESGVVLGAGLGGPCDHVGAPEGREKFIRAVDGAIAAACQKAGLDPRGLRFASACLGFSGGAADKQLLVEEIISAEKLLITTDAEIALLGATGGEPGIVAIAGTGSIAYGRNSRGRAARAGGWGYIFGDEGSAFDIVRQALRAALRAEEGWGGDTALRGGLLEATGCLSINDAMHRFYSADFPRDRVASFAPLVDRAAIDGDETAETILINAAYDLARLALAVKRQIFRNRHDIPINCAGGVFQSTLVRETFQHRITDRSGCPSELATYPPLIGALILAYHAVNLRPTVIRL